MTDRPRRDRNSEAAELLRLARRGREECIDCGKSSKTQRCHACRRAVERNTDRYRGQPRRGPPSRLATDLKDLRYAMASMSSAHAVLDALAQYHDLSRSMREKHLKEPLAQLDLARRFIEDILERNE